MPLAINPGYIFNAGENIIASKLNLANSGSTALDGQSYIFGVGSSGSPSLTFLGDTGTGFYRVSAGVVGLTGALTASGVFTSTVANGTAPFVVASSTNVANLNASSLSGATFAAPGAIGSVTPSSGAFTTLTNTGAANLAKAVGATGVISAGDNGTGNGALRLFGGSGQLGWQIGSNITAANTLEFTPATSAGGTTFTTPMMKLDSTGLTVAGQFAVSPSTTTSAPSAGGAGALPATPKGYATFKVNGTNQQFAYY